MGLFDDDIFGGFFDLNGDGKTSPDEEWFAYMFFDEMYKEFKKAKEESLYDNDDI